MYENKKFLQDLLQPEKLTTVVDIGANPIDGDPPYKAMLEGGLCNVIGFEPQQDAWQTLLFKRGLLETYLPYAIGDGQVHTLYRCLISGMTSLYKPDTRYLSSFNDFDTMGQVVSTEMVQTKRLDDVVEVKAFDLLKIDIQGSELSVFESGRKKLANAVAVHTEVTFMPLYEDQPLFWEVEKELRAQGFVPHTFTAVKRWPISPYSNPENHRTPVNQLLEADVVFVRDFVNPQSMDDEQVKQLALIAQYCYASTDLVTRCLSILCGRGVISESVVNRYRSHLFPDYNFNYSLEVGTSPVSFDW